MSARSTQELVEAVRPWILLEGADARSALSELAERLEQMRQSVNDYQEQLRGAEKHISLTAERLEAAERNASDFYGVSCAYEEQIVALKSSNAELVEALAAIERVPGAQKLTGVHGQTVEAMARIARAALAKAKKPEPATIDDLFIPVPPQASPAGDGG